jgi:CP family cyanate transporter-like MFS transporter
MSDTTNKWPSVALVTGILFIAINLRVPFTATAPVLQLIQDHFHLSITSVGWLNSLPLFAFTVLACQREHCQKFGLERTLFGALMIISGGFAAFGR